MEAGDSVDVCLARVELAVHVALANCNTEEAVLTPSGVPGVRDNPVVGAILVTPADNLDGVATKRGARSVLVDAALVVHEVLVDGEAGLDGAVSHDGDLGRLDVREVLGRALLSGVALELAAITARGRAGPRHAATAGGVGDTSVSGITTALLEAPAEREDTSVAAVVPPVALQLVLGREHHINGAVARNAETIRHDLGH